MGRLGVAADEPIKLVIERRENHCQMQDPFFVTGDTETFIRLVRVPVTVREIGRNCRGGCFKTKAESVGQMTGIGGRLKNKYIGGLRDATELTQRPVHIGDQRNNGMVRWHQKTGIV